MYIYLIEQIEHGFTKIGVSARPSARLKVIQGNNPFKVALRCVMLPKAGRATDLEEQLQSAFSAFHIRGEWFNLRADEIMARIPPDLADCFTIAAPHPAQPERDNPAPRADKYPPRLANRRCEGCGATFTPTRRDQQYHSAACANATRQRRHRART